MTPGEWVHQAAMDAIETSQNSFDHLVVMWQRSRVDDTWDLAAAVRDALRECESDDDDNAVVKLLRSWQEAVVVDEDEPDPGPGPTWTRPGSWRPYPRRSTLWIEHGTFRRPRERSELIIVGDEPARRSPALWRRLLGPVAFTITLFPRGDDTAAGMKARRSLGSWGPAEHVPPDEPPELPHMIRVRVPGRGTMKAVLSPRQGEDGATYYDALLGGVS